MAGKKAVRKTKATASTKKMVSIKDPLSKSGVIKSLSDMTGLAKREVTSVMDGLIMIIEGHVKSKGPGKFVLPGVFKMVVVKKPARPARKGINPFTGEETTFKAKPAHKVLKIKALKKLKEQVA